MDRGWDFVEWLPSDVSIKVFACLHNPVDLVRATAVSRGWRLFVIGNGFCKNLVMRSYPEVSVFAHVIEVESLFEPIEVVPSNSSEWEGLEKEHRVYALFAQHLRSATESRDCIPQSVAASSTDNYPLEHIDNTLEPSNRFNTRPSYWSSKGARDPGVPETLTYRLSSNLVVVDQINIKPFQAFFQYGQPIYSAQAVRFRMGHSLLLKGIVNNNVDIRATGEQSHCDDYLWSYVSPTYSMVQRNILQTFKLPRPVICIGGILQIEFLGRVQTQEVDGLYYICMCAIQVLGRPSLPSFDVGHFDNSRRLALKYFPHARSHASAGSSRNEQIGSSTDGEGDTRLSVAWQTFAESVRQWRGLNEMIMGTLLGPGNADEDSDEDHVA